MKIAIVTQGFFSAGGVQTVARSMRKHFDRRGHHVEVFDLAAAFRDTNSRNLTRPATWVPGPQIRVAPHDTGVWTVGAPLSEVEALRYAPRATLTRALNDFDVVQTVAGGPALALASSKVARPRVLQVATTVAWERQAVTQTMTPIMRSMAQSMNRVVTRMEALALRSSDSVMVENKQMQSHVEGIVEDTRVLLAPPGIDDTVYTPSSSGWARDGQITALGRLNDPRKGYERMLRAYRDLLRTEPAAPKLVIIGRGEAQPLRELAASLGIHDSVDVIANAPQDVSISQLQSSSVFWQTSYEEGLGLSVIEAMACGVPVVATITAGTETTINHSTTGLLIPQDDGLLTRELIKATTDILNGAYPTMHRLARRRASEHFSLSATFDTYLREYNSLVAAANSQPSGNPTRCDNNVT